MDRRTLFAIALCFVIFVFWQKMYVDPRLPKRPGIELSTPQEGRQAESSVSAAKATTISTEILPVKEAGAIRYKEMAEGLSSIEIPLSTGSVQSGSQNAAFVGWNLKDYHVGLGQDAPTVDVKGITLQNSQAEFAVDAPEYSYLNSVSGYLTKNDRGAIWFYEDPNVKITREISGSEGQPFVDVRFKAEFKTKRPSFAFISLGLRGPEKDPEAHDRQLVYWANKEISRVALSDISLKDVPGPVKWVGVTTRYFVTALIPQGEARGLVQPLGVNTGRVSLVYPINQPNIEIPVRIFFGPKNLELLRSIEPTLDHTVDFGWFTIFAYPMLKIMKWFYHLFHNYGVSIIFLTLFVNLITTPLTYKSMKSMKEMAKLQPQLQRLKDKYKDDKEALNREMLLMMKSHGYNPMAGCLPIFIQMPIFFALYRVLYGSIELYQAPFMLWIKDLSAKDPYYVTPILLTLAMYGSQKLTPTTTTDPAQAKMMQFMPLMFGFFMVTLPSGLAVYMLVNSLASIVRQMILNRKLSPDHVSAIPARAR